MLEPRGSPGISRSGSCEVDVVGPGDDERRQKIFKACMFGLMAGSGVFLALRYLFDLGVDPALIAGAGLGVAVSMFFLKRIDLDNG